jgi:ATP-dependent Lhr-like helicase
VIVDEIHALAGNKRGAHLALSLERLAALTPKPPVRIGLSATQKPIEEVARFLTGTDGDCSIIDTGHIRERRLHLELPRSPLAPIMANEVWTEVYDRLAELIQSHRTTSASARSTSPPIMVPWRAPIGWTRSSVSRRASSRPWWRRLRWNSA